MKRLPFIIIIVAAATVVSSMAFAATTITQASPTIIDGTAFVPSSGVTVQVVTDANGMYYTATAQHSSSDPTRGGLQWSATNGSSTILRKTAVSNGPDAPGTAGTLPSGFQ